MGVTTSTAKFGSKIEADEQHEQLMKMKNYEWESRETNGKRKKIVTKMKENKWNKTGKPTGK